MKFKKAFYLIVDLLFLFCLSAAILEATFLHYKVLWIVLVAIKVLRPYFKFLQYLEEV